MATRARARRSATASLLLGGDDLVGPLVDRLFHDPRIQTRKLTPDRSGQLIGRTEMQISVTGLPFPSPSQPFVISHQPFQLADVISLMTATMGFRKASQLCRPIKADLTGSQCFGHLRSIRQPRRRPTDDPGSLMRHISPGRRPIHHRPVTILKMRLAARFSEIDAISNRPVRPISNSPPAMI